ncbi:hypothetical protein [Parvularcula sp. IMCC14364]|uniref:hypothetical protein n=1 Tax=Parvularcula sp. IMCC14364 TaxID=3067902 RepID=UPI00274116E7|nr:hypothetical protein [Parvularcula sp. IMCC14364]
MEAIFSEIDSLSAVDIAVSAGVVTLSTSAAPQVALEKSAAPKVPTSTMAIDVSPDTDITRKVEEEQREEGGAGLLTEDGPTE